MAGTCSTRLSLLDGSSALFFINMTPDERKQFIKSIGAPETYVTEMNKELKGVQYDIKISKR